MIRSKMLFYALEMFNMLLKLFPVTKGFKMYLSSSHISRKVSTAENAYTLNPKVTVRLLRIYTS